MQQNAFGDGVTSVNGGVISFLKQDNVIGGLIS